MTTETLYTTTDAATRIGASPATIRRICRLATPPIGKMLGRDRVLTSADIESVRKLFRGRAGNPNMVAGNRFGQPPEPAPKKIRKKKKK